MLDYFVQRVPAAQYDGTNSDEMLTMFPPFTDEWGIDRVATVASEVAGVLTIHYANYGGYSPWVFNVGDWYGPSLNKVTDEFMNANYVRVSDIVNP
jgi:hypothetical protein